MLGFPAAPYLWYLTSPATITRRTVLQKVPHRTRGALCACKHKVSGSFHSPPGVLFTFPSQYFSSIGHQVVFRLGGWSPRLPCGFLVSVRTPDTVAIVVISLTGLSPSSVDFPKSFCYDYCRFISPLPRMYFYSRFSLFRFRSPLLAKSRLISLPKGT